MFYLTETVTDVTQTASQSLASSMATNLSADKLIGVFIDFMPYIAGLVVAGLTIYELRKMTKGASKAKVKF